MMILLLIHTVIHAHHGMMTFEGPGSWCGAYDDDDFIAALDSVVCAVVEPGGGDHLMMKTYRLARNGFGVKS